MIVIDANYPTASGRMTLTKNWAMTLQGVFNYRLVDARLGIWRPGLQIWVTAISIRENIPIHQRLKMSLEKVGPGAYDINSGVRGGLGRLAFREDNAAAAPDAPQEHTKGYYCVVQGPSAQIMTAFYYEKASDLDAAVKMASSIEYIGEEF